MPSRINIFHQRSVLWIVVFVSVVMHLIALLIFGSIQMVSYLSQDTEFEEPPPVVLEPPPQPEQKRVKQLSRESSPPRPNPIVVNNPMDVDLPTIEVDDVKASQAIFGRGTGGLGSGFGGGRRDFSTDLFEVDFFNTSSATDNILFIVDYSGSMQRPERQGVMRAELARSIESLPNGINVAVIFFAGPAWIAQKGFDRRDTDDWVYHEAGQIWFTVRPKDIDDLEIPEWERVDEAEKRALLRDIKQTKLQNGTVWDVPFYMGFKMNPLPETIFFMTDGETGQKRGKDAILRMLEMLEEKDLKVPVINTIGMEVPRKTRDDLRELAEETDGEAVFLTGEEYAEENEIDLAEVMKDSPGTKGGRWREGSYTKVAPDEYVFEPEL